MQEKKIDKRRRAMQRKNKRTKKKIIIAGIVILAAILAIGVIFAVHKSQNGNNDDNTSLSNELEDSLYGDASLGIDPKVDEELNDYRTIILYGIDNKNRSDIMMFFCINKKDNTAKVFSVYRDTYMQLSDTETYKVAGTKREFFKCNHAYKYGGKYVSMKELNRHLDMNARECFGMDWEAVGDLIDWLGGLEVNVTEGMIPWMNAQITDENYKIKHAGMQKLTGWQAVQYLRCRKDPGSDATTRAKRNLDVFLQIFEKSKGMSTQEKMNIFESVVGECDSNMSRKKLTELLDTLSKIDLVSEGGWPYEYKILWQDDMSYYYYVPQTLESNVKQLHENVFGQKGYEPTETVKELSKKITEREKEQLK